MTTSSTLEMELYEGWLALLAARYAAILGESRCSRRAIDAKEMDARTVMEMVEDMSRSRATNVASMRERLQNDMGVLVDFGGVHGRLIGGPYRSKPGGMAGVKMAAEISLPCVIDIPTKDFSVPDHDSMLLGMAQSVMWLQRTPVLFVGCAGGIGRTGLFLASMVKLMSWVHKVKIDPIDYVRAVYNPRAVETNEQEDFVYGLNVARLAVAVNCIPKKL